MPEIDGALDEDGFRYVSRPGRARKCGNASPRQALVGSTPWADMDEAGMLAFWQPVKSKPTAIPPPPAYSPPAVPDDVDVVERDKEGEIEHEPEWCECGTLMTWVDGFVSCNCCIALKVAIESDKERANAKSEGEHMPASDAKPDHVPRRQPCQQPDGNVNTLDSRMLEPSSKRSKLITNYDRTVEGSPPPEMCGQPSRCRIDQDSIRERAKE